MRRVLVATCLLASVAALPATVSAASGLRGIMKTWRSHQRTTEAMLTGRTGFDPAAIRQMLQRYADEAGQIATASTGQSAEARDIRARFAAFQADARAAQAASDTPQRLKPSFRQVMSDCQSCHDLYKD